MFAFIILVLVGALVAFVIVAVLSSRGEVMPLELSEQYAPINALKSRYPGVRGSVLGHLASPSRLHDKVEGWNLALWWKESNPPPSLVLHHELRELEERTLSSLMYSCSLSHLQTRGLKAGRDWKDGVGHEVDQGVLSEGIIMPATKDGSRQSSPSRGRMRISWYTSSHTGRGTNSKPRRFRKGTSW